MQRHDAKYQLLERIGRGGMAEVWKARVNGPAGFQKLVAIKRLRPHLNDDRDLVARFIDEARLTARLNHSSICQIVDFGRLGSCYFIAMEYVDGLDLLGALKRLDGLGMRLAPDVALHITAEMLRGLGYAHHLADELGRPLGIVHRDVSPQNVLLSFTGGVKLCDFGLLTADRAVRSARTRAAAVPGKLFYIAPEAMGGRPVDGRADLFAVGLVLCEMLLGAAAFRQVVMRSLDARERLGPLAARRLSPEMAPTVEAVLSSALERDPEGRYPDAAVMLEDIQLCLARIRKADGAERVAALLGALEGIAEDDREGEPGRHEPEESSMSDVPTTTRKPDRCRTRRGVPAARTEPVDARDILAIHEIDAPAAARGAVAEEGQREGETAVFVRSKAVSPTR